MVYNDIFAVNHNTEHENATGTVKSITRKLWKRMITANQQLLLLRKLLKLKLGTTSVEDYCENEVSRKKSKKNNKDRDAELVTEIMKKKVSDAEAVLRTVEKRKLRWRNKVNKKWGKNTRRTRNLMNMMKKECEILKKKLLKKNNKKVQHLVKKYLKKEEKTIPEKLKRYANISIFKNEEPETNES